MTGADDPGAALRPPRRPPSGRLQVWCLTLQAIAGLLGAAGIAVAAAAAHKGGGELASTAATFMLVHAVAVLALVAWTRVSGAAWPGSLVAAVLLVFGTILFSGDLAAAGLANWRPWPTAAPIGGMLLIAGWVVIPISAALEAFARPR